MSAINTELENCQVIDPRERFIAFLNSPEAQGEMDKQFIIALLGCRDNTEAHNANG